MNKFLSGMGMGVCVGAACGFAASMMTSNADRRRLRRKADRAVREFSSMASDLREMLR